MNIIPRKRLVLPQTPLPQLYIQPMRFSRLRRLRGLRDHVTSYNRLAVKSPDARDSLRISKAPGHPDHYWHPALFPGSVLRSTVGDLRGLPNLIVEQVALGWLASQYLSERSTFASQIAQTRKNPEGNIPYLFRFSC